MSACTYDAKLAALNERGWRLCKGNALLLALLAAVSASARELGMQDLVVITVKGSALASVAADIAPLPSPHTGYPEPQAENFSLVGNWCFHPLR